MPVTTEKDVVRICGDPRIAALAARAQAVPVNLVLDREAEFRRLLVAALGNQRSGKAGGSDDPCAAVKNRS